MKFIQLNEGYSLRYHFEAPCPEVGDFERYEILKDDNYAGGWLDYDHVNALMDAVDKGLENRAEVIESLTREAKEEINPYSF